MENGEAAGLAEPKFVQQTVTDAMLDLETLGFRPGCIVLSAAVLLFDRNKDTLLSGSSSVTDIHNPLMAKRVVFSMTQQMLKGLVADKSTLEWYYDPKQGGRLEQIVASGACITDLRSSLEDLNSFLLRAQSLAGKDCNIWANSPNFDCEIIQVLYNLYQGAGIKFPFDFRHWMDVRTIRDSYKMFYGYPPKGNVEMKHDPMYDCVYQVDGLQLFWSKVRCAIAGSQVNGQAKQT